MQRLQRVLAQAGVASRRHSADIIKQGRVQVDGAVVREPGARVDPWRVTVTVDGEPITAGEPKVYLLLNKPAGYLCTARDPQGRPTVLDLVPAGRHRLFPVGRLDFDTEGLILLTNDGDAAYALTHPSFEVTKTYVARVKGVPDERALEALRRGVRLDDVVTAPARARVLESDMERALVEVEVHEGRKREVRRMLAAVGHPVLHLRRIRLGRLALGDLDAGSWRPLDADEVEWVQSLAERAAEKAKRSTGAEGRERRSPGDIDPNEVGPTRAGS